MWCSQRVSLKKLQISLLHHDQVFPNSFANIPNRFIASRKILSCETSISNTSLFITKKPFHFGFMTNSIKRYKSEIPLNAQVASPQQKMFIQTEKTPNPDSLKFIPGYPVLPPESGITSLNFANANEARTSPLAKKFFQIPGVRGVFFGSTFITINKEERDEWRYLKQLIILEIMNFQKSGESIIGSSKSSDSDTAIQPEDSEIVQSIKEILETRVRPAVQDDGGDIVYKGFENGVVFLKMQGSCSGCPSSSVTLKNGIERMLMHWVPEVVGVVAVSDEELEKIGLEQFKKVEQKIEEEKKH